METATKRKAKKVEPVVSSPLVKYTLKAIIPTGPYANIQPEITVEAITLEEAHKFVMPYIDGLFKEYLNLSDRVKPKVTITVKNADSLDIRVPTQTEAHLKAMTAVDNSNSLEALNLIADRIARSEKLSPMEKLDLNLPLAFKREKIEARIKQDQEYRARLPEDESIVDDKVA